MHAWVEAWGEGYATYISSSFQFPISPPVFQKGRYMATNSPHFFSFRHVLKVSLSIEYVRMIVNLDCRVAYRLWFQRMSSPRWRIVGLDGSDGSEGGVRPASWGANGAAAMVVFCTRR